MVRTILAIVFVVVFCNPASSRPSRDITVATFNIQNFGARKVAVEKTRRYLAEVVRAFDIVAVQEISDIRNRTPGLFLAEINATGRKYAMVISERTGRQPEDRASQEQYGFYYDSSRIDALDRGVLFDDSAKDLFQREPFTMRFGVAGTAFVFAVTQIHTQPKRAVAEIAALFTVHNDVMSRHPAERNHIILGDFNASCTYAKAAQLNKMAIRGAGFRWVVPDDADTTVSPNTRCAYDRIVLTDAVTKRLVRWGIADWFADRKISDHWPVWASFTPVQYESE